MSEKYQKYKETIRAYQRANQSKINEYYRNKRKEKKAEKEREFVLNYIATKL